MVQLRWNLAPYSTRLWNRDFPESFIHHIRLRERQQLPIDRDKSIRFNDWRSRAIDGRRRPALLLNGPSGIADIADWSCNPIARRRPWNCALHLPMAEEWRQSQR